MNKLRFLMTNLVMFSLGIIIGAYLFSHSQPRSFLKLSKCEHCMRPSEVIGLLASVGIQRFPGIIPSVVFETDKSIAISISGSPERFHYVIFPKKDITSIGNITKDDVPYLTDAYFVAKQLIEEKHLYKYRLTTNGPGYQDVNYLHLHLIN
jgi:Scavenger mRNA decapping enzyme C-term binding